MLKPSATRSVHARLLQSRPELLFMPLVAALMVWCWDSIADGIGWSTSFLLYLTHPFETPIFPFTWSAAWIVFIGALFASKRWTHLGLVRGALVGVSLPFGGTGLFEIIYQFIGARVQPWAFHMSAYDWFGLVLWTAVGLTSLPFWDLTWEYWALVGLTTTGFLAWTFAGFPQVTWGTIQEIPVAYAFNIALKAATYLVFVLPTIRGFFKGSPDSQSDKTE